jgi:hypothetical protein
MTSSPGYRMLACGELGIIAPRIERRGKPGNQRYRHVADAFGCSRQIFRERAAQLIQASAQQQKFRIVDLDTVVTVFEVAHAGHSFPPGLAPRCGVTTAARDWFGAVKLVIVGAAPWSPLQAIPVWLKVKPSTPVAGPGGPTD